MNLIYIDPPFAVGADFGFNIEIGGETAEKKQSVIEEIAYRDTWGKGISSYLSMMYERLKLMHSLLAENGSIYVHCDYRVGTHLKLLLDDIFGMSNYKNEIIWQRTIAKALMTKRMPASAKSFSSIEKCDASKSVSRKVAIVCLDVAIDL